MTVSPTATRAAREWPSSGWPAGLHLGLIAPILYQEYTLLGAGQDLAVAVTAMLVGLGLAMAAIVDEGVDAGRGRICWAVALWQATIPFGLRYCGVWSLGADSAGGALLGFLVLSAATCFSPCFLSGPSLAARSIRWRRRERLGFLAGLTAASVPVLLRVPVWPDLAPLVYVGLALFLTCRAFPPRRAILAVGLPALVYLNCYVQLRAHSLQIVGLRVHGLGGCRFEALRPSLGGPLLALRDDQLRRRLFQGPIELPSLARQPDRDLCLVEIPLALARAGPVALVTRLDALQPTFPSTRTAVPVVLDPGGTGLPSTGKLPGGTALAIVDLPLATDLAGAVPQGLEFLASLKRALAPKGIVAALLPAQLASTRKEAFRLPAALARTFRQVIAFGRSPSDHAWLVAGDELPFTLEQLGRRLAAAGGPGWVVHDDRALRYHLGNVQPLSIRSPGTVLWSQLAVAHEAFGPRLWSRLALEKIPAKPQPLYRPSASVGGQTGVDGPR